MSKLNLIIYIALLVILDYLIKGYASAHLNPFETIQFLPFLNFYLTSNTGIAFSMFDFGSGLSSYILLVQIFFIFYFLLLN